MVITLSGKNSFLRGQKLAELKQSFVQEHGESGVETIQAEGLTTQELKGLVAGVSLFAEHRFIVLKEVSGNKAITEALGSILDSVPDTTTLVLLEAVFDKRTQFYKVLQKQSELLICDEPSDQELLAWIPQFAQSLGGKVQNSGARQLLEYVGPDQERLAHELEKLVSYSPEIDKQSIELLVEKRPQESVFLLLDAVIAGKTHEALNLLARLEQAYEDPYQIANMLTWQMQVVAVLVVAPDVSESELAKQTKLNPYVLKKSRRFTDQLSKSAFYELIDQVARLDIMLKTTATNPWRVLEQTIFSI